MARAKPLATPLTVTGVSAALGRALERAGRKAGRQVIAAPAGPLGTFAPQPMRPGAAVGVSYSMGDIQVGAIGTVAYTDEDRVWAFGHPFENAGERRLLLQDAYVYRVIDNPVAIPGAASTYKYASLGHTLGTISNDERDAVAGRTGALPPTVPIRVFANDLDTDRSTVTGIRAADESRIGLPEGASPLSFIAPLAVTEAAGSLLRSAPGRLTANVCVQVSIGGLSRPARFCNRYVSAFPADEDFVGTANTVAARASSDVFEALTAIDDYQGKPPRIGEVAVRMDLERGEQRAFLRSIRLPARVRAGRTVKARVTLRRVRGSIFKRTYRLKIPRGLRAGQRTIRFAGTDADVADDGLLGAIIIDGLDDGAGDPGPKNLEALAKRIRSTERFDGVRMLAGGDVSRAFRDDDVRISGRASATVRVVAALGLEAVDHARRRGHDGRRARHRGGEDGGERLRARGHHVEQRLHRRRLVLDAVGVVGRVAEQRVGQLGLPAEHGLRAARLGDVGHAAGGEAADLGLGVEARPVDVAVAAAVADLDAGLGGAVEQRAPQVGRERVLEDPVAAATVAGLGVEGAQLAVAEPVGEEVQVVEADHRAELDRRVDRAADRHGEHARGALLRERRDVRAVRDEVREPHVALLVAGDVQHLGARERAARDQRIAPRRRDGLGAAPLEARQGVGARSRDDPDGHGAGA